MHPGGDSPGNTTGESLFVPLENDQEMDVDIVGGYEALLKTHDET